MSTFRSGEAAARPSVSLCFPVYKDEATVRKVTEKALAVLEDVAEDYEVVIVDDGSPDRSGEIADGLAEEYDHVFAVHHPENLGYGAAVRTALDRARYEWICLTDGDDEYDVRDLKKLIRLRDHYRLIITFRFVKLYSTFRMFVSWVYNLIVRLMFRTRYRDISTGLRLIHRDVVDGLDLRSDSPFIGAEITIKAMLSGAPVGEVGIQTFPREFGRGSSVTPKNILATIRDLFSTYRTIFSSSYSLPEDRSRGGM
jgi:glycosyltransferase involved in cell wall biosynthesis